MSTNSSFIEKKTKLSPHVSWSDQLVGQFAQHLAGPPSPMKSKKVILMLPSFYLIINVTLKMQMYFKIEMDIYYLYLFKCVQFVFVRKKYLIFILDFSSMLRTCEEVVECTALTSTLLAKYVCRPKELQKLQDKIMIYCTLYCITLLLSQLIVNIFNVCLQA